MSSFDGRSDDTNRAAQKVWSCHDGLTAGFEHGRAIACRARVIRVRGQQLMKRTLTFAVDGRARACTISPRIQGVFCRRRSFVASWFSFLIGVSL